MPTLPLIAHHRPDAVVAWRDSLPVSAREFLNAADQVAGLLPPGRHVVNLCRDRYRFTVALAACIISARVSLLPSTHTPEMLRQMRRIAPDVFCIADQGAGGADLPVFHYPEPRPTSGADRAIPAIDCEQVIAQVFTSGSTGVPEPHLKRWGSLVRNVRAESATAPLSRDLAVAAETRFAAPLFEIYGCTETGQIASRRTTCTAAWQTFPEVRLRCEGEHVWAEGGHVTAPILLGDVIDLVDADPTRFLLHGRHADLVNIAGKRTSLGYLNYQLNAITGVLDGVFLAPLDGDDQAAGGIRRLIALVVAPELAPAALVGALRERIDPVFLPRPLLFVDALPRNAAGKLPEHAAQALLARLRPPTATGVPT